MISGLPLEDEQLRAEVGTIIMGGFETTAHSLAFTIYCIATSSATESSILDEMQRLGLIEPVTVASHRLTGKQIRELRDLTYDDTRHLVTVSSAIKEAMRMYPVVAGIPRSANFPWLSYVCVPRSLVKIIRQRQSHVASHICGTMRSWFTRHILLPCGIDISVVFTLRRSWNKSSWGVSVKDRSKYIRWVWYLCMQRDGQKHFNWSALHTQRRAGLPSVSWHAQQSSSLDRPWNIRSQPVALSTLPFLGNL